MPTGYYSSAEKNTIRQYFDLPLLQALRQKTNADLRYFGLPGEEMLDIKVWSHLINHVHAVENERKILEKIERTFIMQFPNIHAECHWGDVDKVILANRGNRRTIGGQQKCPYVGNFWCYQTKAWAWDFDIINLDYFGPFLPPDFPDIPDRIKNRTNALRKLFGFDRQDSWKRWVLLITVEASAITNSDINLLKGYLDSLKIDSSDAVKNNIDFLLSPTLEKEKEMTRLVHGTSAVLLFNAANSVGLHTYPRGTILYHGANDLPMIHLIYEFEPSGEPLVFAISRETILCAPLLKLRNPLREPWFELLPEQPPGLSIEKINTCLDFLNPEWVSEIARNQINS